MVEEHVLRQLESDGFAIEMLRPEKDGITLWAPDKHPMYVPGAACSRTYIERLLRAGYTMTPPARKTESKAPVAKSKNRR